MSIDNRVQFPNQRIIRIEERGECSGESRAILTETEINGVCRELNDKSAGIFLYLYLAKYKDGEELALYPAQIERETGLSLKAIHTAINRLKAKGCLIPTDESGKVLIFNRAPFAENDERGSDHCILIGIENGEDNDNE